MTMLRVATWNVNSLRIRLPQVLDWLAEAQPDLLALQETKLIDRDFPAERFRALGYQSYYAGQKTYNGVAILSKRAAEGFVTDLPGLEGDPQRRLLGACYGVLTVVNVYVPNGAAIGSEKYGYKLRWLKYLKAYIGQLLTSGAPLVLLGDFNIAPEDRDVHDPAVWEGQVLGSPAERACLRALLALGLKDTFRLFEQAPMSFSWWDYRAGSFRRNQGLRLDLILASTPLAVCCSACWIDKGPRREEQPSDHTPVVAEFDIVL